MKRFLPALGWFFGGLGGTMLFCFIPFFIGFLFRDEVSGNRLGIWAGVTVVMIYITLPIGILGSLFMTLSKLRGVIDTDALEYKKQ